MRHYPSLQLSDRAQSRDLFVVAVPFLIIAFIGIVMIGNEPMTDETADSQSLVVEVEQSLLEQQGPNVGRQETNVTTTDVAAAVHESSAVANNICLDDGPSLVTDLTTIVLTGDLVQVRGTVQLSADCVPDAHADAETLAESVTTVEVDELLDLSRPGSVVSIETTDGINLGTVELSVQDHAQTA